MKARTFLISLIIGLLFLACEEETTGPDDTNGEPVQDKILFFRMVETDENYTYITELCTINPDGTELTVLVSGYYLTNGYSPDVLYFIGARWSPDLELIATSGGPGATFVTYAAYVPMWLLSPDGTFLENIVSSESGSILKWLDDETLVYEKYSTNNTLNSYNINTSEIEELYDTPADDSVYSFCDYYEENTWLAKGYSPDANRFEVFFVDIETGEREYFLHDHQFNMSDGRISPDMMRICYCGTDIGVVHNLSLYVADIENPVPQKLAIPDSTVKGYYAWDPESSKIAFTGKNGDNDYNTDLFIYDLETGEIDAVTNMGKNGWHLEVYDWR